MASTSPAQESGTPNMGQSPASIYTMPEQFLVLTRAKEMPRQVIQPAVPTDPQRAVMQSVPTTAPTSTPKSAVGGIEQATESGMRRTLILWGAIGGGLLILGGIAAFFVLRSVSAPAPVSTPTNIAPTNNAPPPPVNQEPPAPADVAPVVEPPPSVDVPVSPDVDSDSDGLTDAEENVLGTDVSVRDTDSDGFDDRTEILNLYNPTGTAPQKIIDSGPVFEYENPRYGWKIFVPKSWAIAATDQEQREVVIASGVSGEEVVVKVVEGEAVVGPHDTDPGIQPVVTKRGVSGMRKIGTEENETRFPLTDSLTLTLTHRITDLPARFPRIFDMIVQSFAVVGSR